MFFNKNTTKVSELDAPSTIIGKGVHLDAAKLSGNDSIRVDGTFKGILETTGALVLGDEGVINGNVYADYFLAAGEVNGDIECTTQLHLAHTAKIWGNIKTASIIVDEGAKVSGVYSVGEDKIKKEANNNNHSNDEDEEL